MLFVAVWRCGNVDNVDIGTVQKLIQRIKCSAMTVALTPVNRFLLRPIPDTN